MIEITETHTHKSIAENLILEIKKPLNSVKIHFRKFHYIFNIFLQYIVKRNKNYPLLYNHNKYVFLKAKIISIDIINYLNIFFF